MGELQGKLFKVVFFHRKSDNFIIYYMLNHLAGVEVNGFISRKKVQEFYDANYKKIKIMNHLELSEIGFEQIEKGKKA